MTTILPTHRSEPEVRTGIGEYAFYVTEGLYQLTGRKPMDTKAWWESKINWTSVLGVIAQVANFAGYVAPPDLIPQAAVALAAVQSLATFVWRTWFTKKVVV